MRLLLSAAAAPRAASLFARFELAMTLSLILTVRDRRKKILKNIFFRPVSILTTKKNKKR